jgi:hypothetical protein
MAATDPLPQFTGADVLDPLFQKLTRGGGMPSGEARWQILEAVKKGELPLLIRVPGGLRAVKPHEPETEEEIKQQHEEYRDARARWDYEAEADAIYGTSPPGGLEARIEFHDWERTVTLIIRNEHLFIDLIDPPFGRDAYRFAVADPTAVDKFLAAATIRTLTVPPQRALLDRLPAEIRDSLTEEERNLLPFLGKVCPPDGNPKGRRNATLELLRKAGASFSESVYDRLIRKLKPFWGKG